MPATQNRSCEKCGGEISADQIIQKQAGLVQGKLLCVACVDVLRKEHAMSRSGLLRTPTASAANNADVHAAAQTGSGTASAVEEAEAAAGSSAPQQDQPIALISDDEATISTKQPDRSRAIHSSSGTLGVAHRAEDKYQRALTTADQGASRCRIFHARLSDGAISYLESQVNDWLDANPNVYIKFSTTTVGSFEAKQHTEQHLIVALFY
jgi:hypothetical protein